MCLHPCTLTQSHSVYAPNQWPERPADFERVIKNYYAAAMRVAMDVLRAIADALDLDRDYFTDKFSHPMALLRGNYYPARPYWAGDKDFGIAAPHRLRLCNFACHRWGWRA